MMFGVGVLRWEEQEKIQKIVTKYGRWVLGLNWNTPGYIVQEEVGDRNYLGKDIVEEV